MIKPNESILLIVDMQERIFNQVLNKEKLLSKIKQLAKGCSVLGLESIVTEQYPDKLGKTTPKLGEYISGVTVCKRCFSCLADNNFKNLMNSKLNHKIIICGIESHICIQQTALDLKEVGFTVLVAVDAISARNSIDHEISIRRMEQAGIIITTVESILFELCHSSESKHFKLISSIIKGDN